MNKDEQIAHLKKMVQYWKQFHRDQIEILQDTISLLELENIKLKKNKKKGK